MISTNHWIGLLSLPIFTMGMIHAADCDCAVTGVKEFVMEEDNGLKCPVNAKEGCEGGYCTKKAKEDVSVEYQGRKVYFCCKGCVDIFKKSPEGFTEQVKAQWKVIDAKKTEKK